MYNVYIYPSVLEVGGLRPGWVLGRPSSILQVAYSVWQRSEAGSKTACKSSKDTNPIPRIFKFMILPGAPGVPRDPSPPVLSLGFPQTDFRKTQTVRAEEPCSVSQRTSMPTFLWYDWD